MSSRLKVLPAALVCGFLATTSAHAQQQRYTFVYTGAITTFTAPANSSYEIVAYGAQGGSSKNCGIGGGGRGGEIGATFTLAAGEVLQIAVGGAGGDGDRTGGGGGGTFVVSEDGRPIVVAGGGGGAGSISGAGCQIGLGGLIGPDGGVYGSGNAAGAGGINGTGGVGGRIMQSGGGGGGFLTAGSDSGGGPGTGGGQGGQAWPGLAGGAGFGPGGFGGGGGAGGRGGGGGGGFSGGGGGVGGNLGQGPGGGGGSAAGKNPVAVPNLQVGNGEVVITTVPSVFAGKPGTTNCQVKSIAQLQQEFQGLNKAAVALGVANKFVLENDILEFCEG